MTEERIVERLQQAGRVALLLGLAMVFVSLTFGFDEPGSDITRTSALFPGDRLVDVGGMLRATIIAQGIVGALLVLGGAGIRKCREWARRLLLGVVFAGFAYCLVFVVLFIADLVKTAGLGTLSLGVGGLALVLTAFWCFILRIPLRFLRSQEVRVVCS